MQSCVGLEYEFQPEEIEGKIMISTVLLVIAFILFVIAAIPAGAKLPFSAVPAGLAVWVLSILVGTL